MDRGHAATATQGRRPVVLAVIQLLRNRNNDADAAELEAALARADANFDLVIARATGTDTSPLPEPGSVDEGRPLDVGLRSGSTSAARRSCAGSQGASSLSFWPWMKPASASSAINAGRQRGRSRSAGARGASPRSHAAGGDTEARAETWAREHPITALIVEKDREGERAMPVLRRATAGRRRRHLRGPVWSARGVGNP